MSRLVVVARLVPVKLLVERVVFVLNAVEVVLDVDVDVPNVVVKAVVVERLAGILVFVSNCVVVLLLVELEVPKVTVVLNEVVYSELEDFIVFEHGIAFDERIVEGLHAIFFDLKCKLLPVHFDVV